MSVYPLQPSFAGGELSPSLWGRVDLNKYSIGLRTLENFVVHPHGGVSRRGGMKFIAQARGRCRLVSFQYSLDQSYVLEFGAGYVRFFYNGAQVLNDDGTPYTISTPYSETDVFSLAFTQSADVLFIVHNNYAQRELARYGHRDWRLTEITFSGGPFKAKDEGQDDIKLTPSGQTGTITVTASSGVFQSGHVGSLWSITHYVEQAEVRMTTAATLQLRAYGTWHVDTAGFWAGTFYLQRYDEDEDRWVTMKTYYSPESAQTSKNFSDSGEVDEPTELRLYSGDFHGFVPTDNTTADMGYAILSRDETTHTGIFRVTSVNSTTQVTANVEEYIASTSATVNWQEGAWSDVRGYPRAAGFYQERLCFGGSTYEPQTLWFSRTGDYYDFSTSYPVQDDDEVSITLAARQVNAVRYMVPLSDLLVMTSGSEWKVSAGATSDALTPTSVYAAPQGYRGSAEIDPVVVGNMILYVQSQGSRVRDLGYSFESDSYTGNDLTVMATHLLRGHSIIDWAYQQEPDTACWVVRDDGLLMSLTYLREHDVIAWARHPTDGTVESVASVSSSDGDSVYLCVLRNGVRCIELMNSDECTDATEAFYLDSGVMVTGSNITEVSGLSHLEGQTVSVLADGSYIWDTVVSGGKITISYGASVVAVGLNYSSTLETLDLNVQRSDGTQLGRKARVSAVTVRVENTRALWVGTDEDHLQEFFERTTEPYGTPIELYTGDRRYVLNSRYDAGRLVLKTKLPLPVSVLALMPEVDLGG